VDLGGQNMHFETNGAFTGEVSAQMLIECGCKYVILGHSERRNIFKESPSFIASKIRRALDTGLVPVICVGELLSEREKGETEQVLTHQITEAFKVIKKEEAAAVVVAYEPVWAIGTGVNATSQDAQAGTGFIRKILSQSHVGAEADKIRILYGGSVKSSNIAEYMAQPDIDGALVGGASLDPAAFTKIVRYDEN
jgi:triosephosphate isomerase